MLSMLGAATLVVACGSSPDVPSLPATVTLAPGESAIAESVRVTFVKVTADWRCPINAICASAGEAMAIFNVTAHGVEASPELGVVDPAKRITVVNGIVVEFEDLQPLPFAGQPTDPKSYRARVKISLR
jgi:hypothetical protein